MGRRGFAILKANIEKTMYITVKMQNMGVSGAITEYLERKISIIEKFLGQNHSQARAEAIIGKKGKQANGMGLFFAEATVSLPGKKFYAKASHEDPYAAIDALKEELERGVTSKKDKQKSMMRRSGVMVKNILRDFYTGLGERAQSGFDRSILLAKNLKGFNWRRNKK